MKRHDSTAEFKQTAALMRTAAALIKVPATVVSQRRLDILIFAKYEIQQRAFVQDCISSPLRRREPNCCGCRVFEEKEFEHSRRDECDIVSRAINSV